MNVHPIKKKVTPKMLLGRGFYSPIEKEQAWQQVKAKLERMGID